MYAVIELGGRQWKVEPGSRIDVNRLADEVGAMHTVERVLIAYDGQSMQVGRPYLSGAKVICEVIEHRLGPKVVSYHYRRRENWRKTVGHRQPLSRLEVKELRLPDGSSVTSPEKEARATPARPKPAAPAAVKTAAAPRAAAKRVVSKPAVKKKRAS
jgi:large subunit ribosomal protein L21